MVVEHDEVFAGLMVDEVFGLQHFAQDSLEPADDDCSGPIAAFVKGRFQREQTLAGVQPVCVGAVTRFMNVAL